MLNHLRVRNLGVLEDASVQPCPGFTVITGETGAGKTLLLGGLRLVLGGKPDTASVGPFDDSSMAEGLFETDGEETGVSRVVPREGNSRAYLEGAVVSAATLAEKVGSFVEVVAQHDHVGLGRASTILTFVDALLDGQGAKTWAAYQKAWNDLQEALQRQEMVGGDPMALERELDLVRHQVSEIDGSGLQPGDDETLAAEAARLRNAEEITEELATTVRQLDVIDESLGEVVARLRGVRDLDPASAELATKAENLATETTELRREVRGSAESVESDPERLDLVEERLTMLGDLKRKYGKTLDEVLDFGRQAEERASELDHLLATAEEIEAEVAECRQRVGDLAIELRAHRQRAAQSLTEGASRHLGDLGLSRCLLEVRFEEVAPGPTGSDRLGLWFSSDDRIPPGPIGSVASGGELSRLVLAVRLAARSPATATLVFDEVDAGVGGATALELGKKIAELGRNAQVLCVTHLPQVAVFADVHYVVTRRGATAHVERVSEGERLQEISRMLAGLPESEVGQQAAEELLATASG